MVKQVMLFMGDTLCQCRLTFRHKCALKRVSERRIYVILRNPGVVLGGKAVPLNQVGFPPLKHNSTA